MTFCKGNPRAHGEKGTLEVYVFAGYIVCEPDAAPMMVAFGHDRASAVVLLK